MLKYSSFSDFRFGGHRKATDIPVLLRSPWHNLACKKIATQIQCELLSHATNLLLIIVY